MRSTASEKTTDIDLGDNLLVEILDVVRNSALPVQRKVKALLRAGKVGEMYSGVCSDESAQSVFNWPRHGTNLLTGA